MLPASMAATHRSKRFVVSVNRDWCKGCSICVAFCPTRVLGLDDAEKAVALRPEACTGCRLCELRCPDFAIAVEEAGAPQAAAVAIAAEAADLAPEASPEARSPEDD